MLYAKLHRVTVNQSDMNYVGSVTIDRTLLEAAHLLPGERVDVVDVTNGSRLTTYVIEVSMALPLTWSSQATSPSSSPTR